MSTTAALRTTTAVRLHATGGPDVLHLERVPVPAPGPGEVLLRQTRVGVNYVDVYHRTGFYPVPLPSGLGVEGVGVVEAVGDGVTALRPGQRAAYAGRPLGAYAGARVLPADRLVAVPDSISDDDAAALLFKGLTAHMLIHRVRPVKPGEWALVHAAAGGVGSIVVQWLRALGVNVIGTVSSEAKAEKVRANGAQLVLVHGHADVPAAVRALAGRGVDVVYDSIGLDTWRASLDALAPLGLFVSFGQASGAVPPFSVDELAKRGSLFVTRPSLFTYTEQPADLRAGAAALFAAVAAGHVKPEVFDVRPMSAVAAAHRELEGRSTTGALLLDPER